MMRDPDFGIVRVRAYGTFDFHVVDPKLFLKEVAGTDDHFRLDEFADTMRSRIVSVFSEALASAKVPVLDVASRYQELGEALLPLINPAVTSKYGLEIPSFIVENVSVPPEVEQAIDKRSSMAAVGNLNDYVKFQMAEGMTKGGKAAAWPAPRRNSAPAWRWASRWRQAMGAAQVHPARRPRGRRAAAQAPPGRNAGTCSAPADAAKVLGVSESDVLSDPGRRLAQGQEDRRHLAHHARGAGRVSEELNGWVDGSERHRAGSPILSFTSASIPDLM